MKNFVKKFKNILIICGVFLVLMVVNSIIPRNSSDDLNIMPIAKSETRAIFIAGIVLFAVLILGLLLIAKSKKNKKQKEEYKGVLCAAVSIIIELLCILLTIAGNLFGLYGLITSVIFYGCMIASFSAFDTITFDVGNVPAEEKVEEVQVEEKTEKDPAEEKAEEVQVEEKVEDAPVEEKVEEVQVEDAPAEEKTEEVQIEETPTENKSTAKKPSTSRSKKVDYNKLTIPELKELAKQKGISGYSKLKKQELIDLLSKPKPRKKTK